MRQRYYNPEVKRFVNQDILSGNLSNSQSLNRYSYVQGNPVSYTDPFGLSPLNGLFKGNTLWHGVLGLLGMVPGFVGATANFIDGVIYLCEGDYFGAALCFTNFATMGATSYATYAVKAGKFGKTASAAVKVAMISERISGGLCFAKNTYNVGKGGIQMYCKYGILEQSFGLDTVGEVLGIGLSILGTAGGLNRMGSNSAELIALNNAIEELMGGTSSGFYQDVNGRWHRPNGQFASNAEVGITSPTKVSTGSHGNSLSDTRTNYGYVLVDRDTNEILKFGETIHPTTRYSQSYLDANNANMMILEQGNKLDIHLWQHDMNEYYFYKYNEYPPLNGGGW